uniref:Uncharacterized protein n=1 Tax=viral metagenome TaxID=1070528 RepID=A0A6M3KSN5_9ZZZZ
MYHLATEPLKTIRTQPILDGTTGLTGDDLRFHTMEVCKVLLQVSDDVQRYDECLSASLRGMIGKLQRKVGI